MKDQIEEQIVTVLSIYKDPKDLEKILDKKDYAGRSVIDYFFENEYFKILSAPSMFKYVGMKWNGSVVNASIYEFMTSYTVFKGGKHFKLKTWHWSEFFDTVHKGMDERSKLVHVFKYEAWKKSMMLRYYVDATIVLILTIIIIFLVYDWQKNLTLSVEELHAYVQHKQRGNFLEMYMSMDYLHREWQHAAWDFILAIDFSYYNCFLPLNLVQRFFFLYKTERSFSNLFDLGYKIDIVLFGLVIYWHKNFYEFMEKPVVTAIDLGEMS